MLAASKQRGVSLVELMVASAISILAIGSVGAVYISGHQAAYSRTQQLMLKQEVNDAVRIITEEMQRAGYSSREKSIKLSGAMNVVGIHSGGEQLDFVYETSSTAWKTFGFVKKPANASHDYDWLKICVKNETPTSSAVTTDTAEAFCYSQSGGAGSLLNSNMIEVTAFDVTEEIISSASSTSQRLTVVLAASMPSVSGATYTKEKTIVLRNWQ